MNFPEQFIWGASTSSYQIEGAWDADDKGASIWDMFTSDPARIWSGHNGKLACDHYHRYREDVAIMAKIGLKAYRFSISWPRVIPDGIGRPSTKGLDFYDKLVDTLLENRIAPWVTLFHWDYPYELFLKGGWLNPESPGWFAKFTEVVVDRLSDRVSDWVSLNEPQCFIGLGHYNGEHAPGLKLNLKEVLLAGHHALIAHGLAVQTIRARAKTPPRIGCSAAGAVYFPATESAEDIAAAREATLGVYRESVWNTRWWGDPMLLGHYPEEGLRSYGAAAVPKHKDSEMKTIQQPLDFYGCNIFQGPAIKADPEGKPALSPVAPGQPHTHYMWQNTPQAMYWGTKFLAEQYQIPLVITENGISTLDWVGMDERVHDQNRIDFMSSYLMQIRRALIDGIDILGYFCWTLMDNFEWNEGYKHRFGLVHVDFETQKRTLKDSAYWYHDVIASGGGIFDALAGKNEPAIPFVVKETMRYVRAHLSDSFNIKDLATHLRCHPDFLSRKFKQSTGVDLSLYIRRIRVEHSMVLLRNPRTLIDDAAEKSGFSDRIHFTKVFRKLTGQTPGQFQKQFRVDSAQPSGTEVAIKPSNPRSVSSTS